MQRRAEIVSLQPAGAYLTLVLRAPDVAAGARPGHFVALQVGGPDSGLLLRRAFALYDVQPDTVGIVFSVNGRGTAWLAGRRPGELIDVVGPLGTPFTLPEAGTRAVLVGGGYGSAPLLPLAAALQERGCAVDLVLGASTGERLFGAAAAESLAGAGTDAAPGVTVTITTDDGSLGRCGRVSGPLPMLLAGAGAVYACGPMAMLQAVAELSAAHGVACQVAVEESMACGIGVCMTCVLPVADAAGQTRMVRSCVEGPVFAADRVRWDALGTVPADALGAPA